MHPAFITATIKERFGTQAQLARRLSVTPSAISQFLRRPASRSPLGGQIAKALGVSLHALWPDRWSEDGQPLPRLRQAESATPAGTRSSKIRKAA